MGYRRNDDGVASLIAFVVIVIFIIGTYAIGGCTNPKHAQTVLENDGFTDIDFTGYNWFACSNDHYHTGFIATKNGKRIKGTVCEGLLFKNATIRYE